jgi:hypothetical protein
VHALCWIASVKRHFCNDDHIYNTQSALLLHYQGADAQDVKDAMAKAIAGSQWHVNKRLPITVLWADESLAPFQEGSAHLYSQLLAPLYGGSTALKSMRVEVGAESNSDTSAFDKSGTGEAAAGLDFIYIAQSKQLMAGIDVCMDMLGTRVVIPHALFWDKNQHRGPWTEHGAAGINKHKHLMYPFYSSSLFGGEVAQVLLMLEEMKKLAEAVEAEGSKIYTSHTQSSEHWAQHALLNAVVTRPEFTPTVTLSRAFNWPSTGSCERELGRTAFSTGDLGREYCEGVVPLIQRVD